VRPSISRQLVLWLAVPLTLLALCGALAHYFNSVAPAVISSDRRLKDAAAAVMLHRLPAPDSVLYAVRDLQGRLIEGDARLAPVALSDDIGTQNAMAQIDHRNVRTLTTRFDTPTGPLLVTVADIRAAGERAARYGFLSTLLWDFVQLDITLVLVWVGIQLGLRPVKRLREEIAARSPQDLRPIDESTVPREIAPAVVTLNRLFGTLRSSVQSQQQFIQNTAHQLRTPITGLQAQLELLIAESAALPVKNRLLTLQEGIRQLAHSANQLLTLARADPTVNIATKNQTVALDAIAAEVVARFFDRALQSHIDLGADVSAISIHADPSLIDDLLSNLVDNALKYTPSGGTVTVSVRAQAGKAHLSVEDSGPGIPEEHRERVKQRFFRVPNSPGHGSGLGLAIVEEIAHLYGATVAIGTGAGGHGTRIEVRFP
jgi:two-component system, OmpR family, sensor histidine kinase TctE